MLNVCVDSWLAANSVSQSIEKMAIKISERPEGGFFLSLSVYYDIKQRKKTNSVSVWHFGPDLLHVSRDVGLSIHQMEISQRLYVVLPCMTAC